MLPWLIRCNLQLPQTLSNKRQGCQIAPQQSVLQSTSRNPWQARVQKLPRQPRHSILQPKRRQMDHFHRENLSYLSLGLRRSQILPSMVG